MAITMSMCGDGEYKKYSCTSFFFKNPEIKFSSTFHNILPERLYFPGSNVSRNYLSIPHVTV